MRRRAGLLLILAGCAVPPLTIEGRQCATDDPCPEPYRCVALESGGSLCTTGCPEQSSCAPTEGRSCSSASPCPPSHRCVRLGPTASACSSACPANVPFEPLELNCTDALDNDCDGRVGSSRDVVLIEAPAEQPSWAWVSDGGYAAVYVRPQGTHPRLHFQRFDPALVPAGGSVAVSESTSAASEPLLIPLPGQTFGVLWLDKGAPDAGALTRVMFARVDAAGSTVLSPRVLGASSAIRGRPRGAWSNPVGALLVLWIEEPARAAFSVSLLPDGTILRPRAAFPRATGALTGLTQLDLTDRVATNYDAGFAAGWMEQGDSASPWFLFVDRDADPLVRVSMGGSGQRSNLRAGNSLVKNFERTFFVWSESTAGQSTLTGRSTSAGANLFTLAGSLAVANVYQDLELAISSDSTVFNYLDVAAITADGAARIIVSKLFPGNNEPSNSRVQAQFKADARAPVIAIGGGRHAFAYQVDAGPSGLQIRAQLHCNPQ
ncbi:MAG: hypothetical protein H6Q89_888 [Myxococcaceae bacterium]|nr:hypothetical protein [Myxococcaceae bacterium]